MNTKDLKWTSEKPKIAGWYWWTPNEGKDSSVFAARLWHNHSGHMLAEALIAKVNSLERAKKLYTDGYETTEANTGLWAEDAQIKTETKPPKKEHRNSKLARRIKATEKALKAHYASEASLIRIMTENQLALMERILEIDREKGVVIK